MTPHRMDTLCNPRASRFDMYHSSKQLDIGQSASTKSLLQPAQGGTPESNSWAGSLGVSSECAWCARVAWTRRKEFGAPRPSTRARSRVVPSLRAFDSAGFLKSPSRMAGALGFEPRQADPESAVLPLHYAPVKKRLDSGTRIQSRERAGPSNWDSTRPGAKVNRVRRP